MSTVVDAAEAGPGPSSGPQPPPVPLERGLFGAGRRIVHHHAFAADALAAAGLLALCSAWLANSPFAGLRSGLFQAALIIPLAWRRSRPTTVFVVVAALALVQWIVGDRLLADAALLVALYSVAVHEVRRRALVATAVLEVGAILAASRWRPAATVPRSFVFLTATVVAALCAGLTVRSGSQYMGWLAERAERLEIERDQQKAIGAAVERTRIAREVHDIVAHSLAVVITLADAAAVVNASDPARATAAMRQAGDVGRQALSDMRTVVTVLRTEEATADLGPQPDISQLEAMFSRVRATGLMVTVAVEGDAFALGPAGELSVFRILQEALTNTIKHAGATEARVVVRYDHPRLELTVTDNGDGPHPSAGVGPGRRGHGIAGMTERAALHGGSLTAGPAVGGGWRVAVTLRPDPVRT
jgi:signal transduction histidine kinase